MDLKWKHVTCTFDGSTVEIFIDGVSELILKQPPQQTRRKPLRT